MIDAVRKIKRNVLEKSLVICFMLFILGGCIVLLIQLVVMLMILCVHVGMWMYPFPMVMPMIYFT